MTFRAERYPADWATIRARILERAGDRCERCGAENGTAIRRGAGTWQGTYLDADNRVRDAETGEVLGASTPLVYGGRSVVVILTVAHLDHVEGNCDEANLQALCQMHHLAHDAPDNARRRRENDRNARAVGDLPGLEGAKK